MGKNSNSVYFQTQVFGIFITSLLTHSMKHLNAIIFGVAMIIAANFLGSAYVKRSNPARSISITGLGNENFTSDLIVWEGRFSSFNTILKTAFEQLNNDKEIVRDYWYPKGISPENIIFNSVQTIEQRDNKYENGNFVGIRFSGGTNYHNLFK